MRSLAELLQALTDDGTTARVVSATDRELSSRRMSKLFESRPEAVELALQDLLSTHLLHAAQGSESAPETFESNVKNATDALAEALTQYGPVDGVGPIPPIGARIQTDCINTAIENAVRAEFNLGRTVS